MEVRLKSLSENQKTILIHEIPSPVLSLLKDQKNIKITRSPTQCPKQPLNFPI